MPTPTIPAGNLFMNATLYTGTGATQTITNGVAGQAFQPDLVWVKNRNTTDFHILQDSVRGTGKELFSNSTGAEESYANSLTSFNSNGFTLGSRLPPNNTGSAYVGWQWKAGGTAVTNTSGTITSSVSANTTSGFSVVTFAASASNTVGHGLGVAPSMIIIKSRTYVNDWICYHSALGATQYLSLNLTSAASTNSVVWNNTAPTSSVFTIGSGFSSGSYGNCVAYCWAPIAGYSAFGSYTGNGSADGPFVYTGFRPRFLLIKRTNDVASWMLLDTARDPYNYVDNVLYPNASDAENVAGSAYLDIVSNGFKLRIAGGTALNTSGSTYIYAAFAENPFKYANAR